MEVNFPPNEKKGGGVRDWEGDSETANHRECTEKAVGKSSIQSDTICQV